MTTASELTPSTAPSASAPAEVSATSRKVFDALAVAGNLSAPTVAGLAARVGSSTRTVTRSLSQLTAAGWIETVPRFTDSGRQLPSEYRLFVPQSAAQPAITPVPDSPAAGKPAGAAPTSSTGLSQQVLSLAYTAPLFARIIAVDAAGPRGGCLARLGTLAEVETVLHMVAAHCAILDARFERDVEKLRKDHGDDEAAKMEAWRGRYLADQTIERAIGQAMVIANLVEDTDEFTDLLLLIASGLSDYSLGHYEDMDKLHRIALVMVRDDLVPKDLAVFPRITGTTSSRRATGTSSHDWGVARDERLASGEGLPRLKQLSTLGGGAPMPSREEILAALQRPARRRTAH